MRNPCLRGAFFFRPERCFSSLQSIPMVAGGCRGHHRGGVRSEDDRGDLCQTQRAACARAARCDGRCTALRHLPRNTAGWRAVPYARQCSRLLRAGAAFLWSDRNLWASAPLPLGNVGWAGGSICPVPCVGRWGRLPRRMRCAAHIWPLRKKTARKAKKYPPYLYVNQIQ